MIRRSSGGEKDGVIGTSKIGGGGNKKKHRSREIRGGTGYKYLYI